MKAQDSIEVILQTDAYANNGIYKGMQGKIERQWIGNPGWVVAFPAFGRERFACIHEKDMQFLPGKAAAAVNERILCAFGEGPQGEKQLLEMDTVEVTAEKKHYTAAGVHKGMQGWICGKRSENGYWLVNFPQYGEKEDIATIEIHEADLQPILHMDAKVNERIRKLLGGGE